MQAAFTPMRHPVRIAQSQMSDRLPVLLSKFHCVVLRVFGYRELASTFSVAVIHPHTEDGNPLLPSSGDAWIEVDGECTGNRLVLRRVGEDERLPASAAVFARSASGATLLCPNSR